jgi:hypothetical protein
MLLAGKLDLGWLPLPRKFMTAQQQQGLARRVSQFQSEARTRMGHVNQPVHSVLETWTQVGFISTDLPSMPEPALVRDEG